MISKINQITLFIFIFYLSSCNLNSNKNIKTKNISGCDSDIVAKLGEFTMTSDFDCVNNMTSNSEFVHFYKDTNDVLWNEKIPIVPSVRVVFQKDKHLLFIYMGAQFFKNSEIKATNDVTEITKCVNGKYQKWYDLIIYRFYNKNGQVIIKINAHKWVNLTQYQLNFRIYKNDSDYYEFGDDLQGLNGFIK